MGGSRLKRLLWLGVVPPPTFLGCEGEKKRVFTLLTIQHARPRSADFRIQKSQQR